MNKNSGFIALISVIVITLVLLVTTASLATKGFLDRFNILEGEAKETSAGLSAACVEAARVSVAAKGDSYTPNNQELCLEWPCLGEDDDKKCFVESVTPSSAGKRTITAKSVYKGATTKYEVVVNIDLPEIPIVSWKEI